MDEPTTVAIQHPLPPEIIEKVVIGGDLSKLTPKERLSYYKSMCESLGLNPLTQPLAYLNLQGKLTLYAKRDAADQLRKIHGISIEIIEKKFEHDLFIVHVRAHDRHGRSDEDIGFADIKGATGEKLGNAILKAITKSKRRVTLSIAGLGMLDETEVESIPGALVGEPIEYHTRGSLPDDTTQAPEHLHPSSDQINDLIEKARACGIDQAVFGDQMRARLQLPEGTKITKKFLREWLTLEQYEDAYQHYGAILKQQVEQDIADPPVDPVATPIEPATQEAPRDTSKVATDGQLAQLQRDADQLGVEVGTGVQQMIDQHARKVPIGVYEEHRRRLDLRELARTVGTEAESNLQEMFDAHPDGVPIEVYERTKAWLTQRAAEATAPAQQETLV